LNKTKSLIKKSRRNETSGTINNRKTMKKVIKISDATYNKIKDRLDVDDDILIPTLDENVGENVFVMSEHGPCVGKLESAEGGFIKLSSASLVATRGRLSNAIAGGKLEEVTFIGSLKKNIDKVYDIIPWAHALPTEDK